MNGRYVKYITADKGDRLPNVPRWTIAASSDYRFPIGGGIEGTVGGDFTYVSARATDFNVGSPAFRALPSYSLVALRAGLTSDRWSATIIANNLFNTKKIINVTSFIFALSPDQYYVNRPRTIALRLTGKF